MFFSGNQKKKYAYKDKVLLAIDKITSYIQMVWPEVFGYKEISYV